MIKKKVKFLLGAIRTKRFGVHAGKNVYIGKQCSLKGKCRIFLGDFVTVRPYAQVCQFIGNWRESSFLTKCLYY